MEYQLDFIDTLFPISPGSLYTVSEGQYLTLSNYEPPKKLVFVGGDNKVVGELDYSTSPITFTGDFEESAKALLQYVFKLRG